MKVKPRIDLDNRTPLETVIPLSVPFIINVDPSDACNFRCKFCPTGDRTLMKATPGRGHGLMDFGLFRKIIDDIGEFETPIKVLRLYKDGEPLLNPHFVDMVKYARASGCCDRIDTTTNASRLSPELNLQLADAGLNRINVSVYGMTDSQFREFSGARVDFNRFADNLRHLYEHLGEDCELIVKINGDTLNEADRNKFYEVFGDIADGVFVEHIMSCWPEFDLESHGIQANPDVGIYGQPIKEVLVCPYIFYSFSINSDGSASSCFLDWERRLVIGNAGTSKVRDIWNGIALRAHQKLMLAGERKEHPVCGHCDQLKRGAPDDIDNFTGQLLARLNHPSVF